jgi:(p)ppGpp synthase/HD superfamily hydrolase
MKKNMLATAISIVAQAFEEKKDRGGKPYFLHCMRVMNDVPQDDEELMCIAILHDLVEDCPDWSVEELIRMGFSKRITDAVDLLTLRTGQYYEAYIKAIALNNDARLVKLADLRDNSQITRMKGLTAKDFSRLEKYHQSYAYLSKV